MLNLHTETRKLSISPEHTATQTQNLQCPHFWTTDVAKIAFIKINVPDESLQAYLKESTYQ